MIVMIGCLERDYSVTKWAWSKTHSHALLRLIHSGCCIVNFTGIDPEWQVQCQLLRLIHSGCCIVNYWDWSTMASALSNCNHTSQSDEPAARFACLIFYADKIILWQTAQGVKSALEGW